MRLNDVMALGLVPIVMLMMAGRGAPFPGPVSPVPPPRCLVTSGQPRLVAAVDPTGVCEHAYADTRVQTGVGPRIHACTHTPRRLAVRVHVTANRAGYHRGLGASGLCWGALCPLLAGTRGDPRLTPADQGQK